MIDREQNLYLAAEAVDCFIDLVRQALRNGEKVSLVGFGTFMVKTRKPKMGRNPRTGEKVTIPERKAAVFKPGKAFKDLVNQ